MKTIGITGTYGKTSTAEILYQYLLKENKKVMLVCSNGIFINGSTFTKDYFSGTLLPENYENIIKGSGMELDYAILEITAESADFKGNNSSLNYSFDVACLTEFSRYLINPEKYKNWKQQILDKGRVRIAHGDYFGIFNADIFTGSKSIREMNLEYTIFLYENREYRTNLLGEANVRNLTNVIEILKQLGLFSYESFQNFCQKIRVRGRLEYLNVSGKKVLLDTMTQGLKGFFDSLGNLLDNKRIKLLYAFTYNEWAFNQEKFKANRRLEQPFFMNCEKLYLYNDYPEQCDDYEDVFNSSYLLSQHKDFVYSEDFEQCFKKAVSELSSDEILIVKTEQKYRRAKELLEETYF